ncbi:MAG: DUF3857 domain-containing protein [Candidatus Bipolaricaulota bacterium]|nr:DUF3857 domain-containing protein [Candidatus Bipolaricaulota bacterium]
MHSIREVVAGVIACLAFALCCGAQESPADVLARVPMGEYAGFDAVRLLLDLSFDIQTGGVVVLRQHEIIWVGTADGISAATPALVSYQKSLDEVRVLYARTILPGGEVVDASAITHTRPQQQASVLTDDWILRIGFARVGVGCVVEYAVEKTSQPRFRLFAYGLGLADSLWTIEGHVQFTDSTGTGLRYQLWNAPDYDDSVIVTQTDPWSVSVDVSDTCSLDSCSCGAYATSMDPFLVVSQYSSWDVLVDEWRDLLSGRSADTTTIDAKAAELLAGVTGEEETIRVLYEFVRDEIRYLATTFRLEGWRAKPAAETLLRRQGDCKAKSALLIALLAEAGIESYPALVSTVCNLAAGIGEVPWPIDCLDHAVVGVRLADGALRVLDPTCRWCTSSGTEDLSNTTVWVFSDAVGGAFPGELVRLAPRSPTDWMTEAAYDVEVSLSGAAVVTVSLVARSEAGRDWDYTLGGVDSGCDWVYEYACYDLFTEWNDQVGSAVVPRELHPAWTVRDCSLVREDPDRLEMSFEMEGRPYYWEGEDISVAFFPPIELFTGFTLAQLAQTFTSYTPDCMTSITPRDESWTTTLTLPEGVEVVALPENKLVCNSLGSYFAAYAASDGKVVASRKLVIVCDGIDPLEYEDLKEVIDAAVADSTATALLRKAP